MLETPTSDQIARVRDLDVDLHTGLTAAQVEQSLRTYGSNQFTPSPKRPLWLQYLDKFKDPTIIVLGIAALVSLGLGVLDGHYLESVGIIAAIFVATGVGFYSEYKSNNEFELLAQVNERIPVKVTRDGEFQVVTIDDVVTGDLVHLETGDKVPADCQVVRSVDLSVNESLMTGESRAVSRSVEAPALLRGTTVEEGSGAAVVLLVGDQTKLGQIKDSLVEEPRPTPLQEKLADLADKIGKVGMLAALLIFAALLAVSLLHSELPLLPGLLLGLALAVIGAGVFLYGNYGGRGLLLALGIGVVLGAAAFGLGSFTPLQLNHLLEFFLVAVTVVVVAVPEGLPMAVTVSLAFSMRKIAKDGNLVRKLVATETVGAASVIASDKTGTLTQNRMSVQHLFLRGRDIQGADLRRLNGDTDFELLTLCAAANSTAHLQVAEDGRLVYVGNSTEGALLAWLKDQGTPYEECRERFPVLQRRSFSADRKRMTTVVEHGAERLELTKGAPERVIPLCDSIETAAGVRPLAEGLAEVQQFIDRQAESGIRTLALAYKRLPLAEPEGEELEAGLTLLAIVGIADPVREDVAEAIRVCHEAGIDVKMVTGDHQKTAVSIARQIGLLGAHDGLALGGEEFRALSDEQRREIVPHLRVISRAEPLDKLKLVEALQARDEVVAVTGDGTNDAPALKRADVGISMGKSGTDVAKEASDIVLLEDDFGSIVRAVRWGRALYENIQKFIQFQLTVNVSALAIAFLGALFGFGLPLTVIQLLWVNLIMDTLAAIALGLEPPTPGLMSRKPRRRDEPIITRVMWWNILSLGGYFLLATLALLQFNFLGTAPAPGEDPVLKQQTVVFATFVFFQVFNLFNARSLDPARSGLAGLTASPAFLSIMGGIAVLTVLIVQFGGEVFRTTALDLGTWAAIIAFTATALVWGELSRLVRLKVLPHHDAQAPAATNA